MSNEHNKRVLLKHSGTDMTLTEVCKYYNIDYNYAYLVVQRNSLSYNIRKYKKRNKELYTQRTKLKLFSRITYKVDSIYQVCYIIPVSIYKTMLTTHRRRIERLLKLKSTEHNKKQKRKITNLEAKVFFYKRQIKKKIKEVNLLIERIEKTL